MGALSNSPPTICSGEGRKGEREGKEGGGRIASLSFSLPLLLSSSYLAIKGGAAAHASCCVSPLGPIGPNLCRGVPRTPSDDPIRTRYLRNTFGVQILSIVLYMNLYLSTISRLLVMSMISSGAPNNIRSPNHITHIRQNHHRMLSVRTLRVRELCRHDGDISPVNNQ